ncbi:ATP-binding protein [Salininema proteolyticum]|uniref:ATP-binding protein n=1 Tax=Salininema proteolyticum TaxID=1607685 RepID=A0ABV8U2M8_9ACTN
MKFVGREEELSRLEEWWSSDPWMGLIWGRRRVGKTALISRFLADKRAVFYTGRGVTAAAELRQFSNRVASVLHTDQRDLATSDPFQTWDEALDHLADLAMSEPMVLALDEFPELLKAEPALPGILRAFWDRWEGRTELKILLCGSAVRAMFALQTAREPLYGRFGLSLQLHPMAPFEAAQLLPDLEPAARAAAFGICGGMPLHLAMWDQNGSLEDNLSTLVCRPGAALKTEAEFVLHTEAGEGGLPEAVLQSIAQGHTKFSEIQTAVGTNPTRTLERLEELRLIRAVIPVTESTRTRRRHYQITDNLLAFYLGPLSLFADEIELGSGDQIVAPLAASLPENFGRAYEEAVRMHLRRLAVAGELGDRVVKIGSWWGKAGQNEIDLVVLAQPDRTRVPILVGEVKWARSVNASRLKTRLAGKVPELIGDSGVEPKFLIAAREEVTGGDDETYRLTAADVFSTDLRPLSLCD